MFYPVPATGKMARIEMTKTGILIRVKHARQVHHIRFGDLFDIAQGQNLLPLDFRPTGKPATPGGATGHTHNDHTHNECSQSKGN